MKYKIINMMMAIVVLLPLSAPALAADAQPEVHFTEITRTQYIEDIAQSKNITYAEAESEVVQAIRATIEEHNIPIITPFGFEESNNDVANGVKTAYGYWVSYRTVPNTGGIMSVRMSVPGIVISSAQGKYISHVGDSVQVLPGSGGQYTITASGNVNWDSYTVYLNSSGNAEITLTMAYDIGLDAVWINYGQSMGTTNYLRFPFTVGETFRIVNS